MQRLCESWEGRTRWVLCARCSARFADLKGGCSEHFPQVRLGLTGAIRQTKQLPDEGGSHGRCELALRLSLQRCMLSRTNIISPIFYDLACSVESDADAWHEHPSGPRVPSPFYQTLTGRLVPDLDDTHDLRWYSQCHVRHSAKVVAIICLAAALQYGQ